MRSLKIYGIALTAVLLMGAVVASASVADELTAEQAQVILSGTNDPGFVDQFGTTAGVATCKEVLYQSGAVMTPTTTVTVSPVFPEKTKGGENNCTSAGSPATVQVNGCQYVFHVTGGSSTVGDVTLQCPAGQEITVGGAATPRCTLHIGTQTLAGDPLQYTNIGAGTTRELTLSINASNLSYKHTGGTGLAKCSTGSGANGTHVAKGVVTAISSPGGTHVGLFMSNV